jgi:hypothetical protein
MHIPSAKVGVRRRQNGAFVQGLTLKILIEKYFVWKSHKIKLETHGSPGECDFLRNPLAYNKTIIYYI